MCKEQGLKASQAKKNSKVKMQNRNRVQIKFKEDSQ